MIKKEVFRKSNVGVLAWRHLDSLKWKWLQDGRGEGSTSWTQLHPALLVRRVMLSDLPFEVRCGDTCDGSNPERQHWCHCGNNPLKSTHGPEICGWEKTNNEGKKTTRPCLNWFFFHGNFMRSLGSSMLYDASLCLCLFSLLKLDIY